MPLSIGDESLGSIFIETNDPYDSVDDELKSAQSTDLLRPRRPSSDTDTERGFSYERNNIYNTTWWKRIRFMTLRARRKLADTVIENNRATLDLSGTKKNGSIFDYCIFGGISAFSIL